MKKHHGLYERKGNVNVKAPVDKIPACNMRFGGLDEVTPVTKYSPARVELFLKQEA